MPSKLVIKLTSLVIGQTKFSLSRTWKRTQCHFHRIFAPNAQTTRKFQKKQKTKTNQGTYLSSTNLYFLKMSRSRKTEKLFQIEGD